MLQTTSLVSGITFIKNGLSLGYPIKESIISIEPLCDEIIINVGFENEALTRDDGTYQYLKDNFPHKKFVFLKSYWDPQKCFGGNILSEQTNIALKKAKGPICQYIQGDEIIHEDDLKTIHREILNLNQNSALDGLVFEYIHFYASVNLVKKTRNIYRREVRTFKKKNVQSWKDAQGFRKIDNSKLLCKLINARIFHYGWARNEMVMKKKVHQMDKLYHGEKHDDSNFKYQRIWGLKEFKSHHPAVMGAWIKKNDNDITLKNLDYKFEYYSLGLAISDLLESVFGVRLGEYKNYRLK